MGNIVIRSVHQEMHRVDGYGEPPRYKPGAASADALLVLADGSQAELTLRFTPEEYALLHRLTEALAERALATIRAGMAT